MVRPWFTLVALVAACGAVAPPGAPPRSALADAVVRGDVGAVRALLDGGADPERGDGHGDSPLMLAALTGDAALVALLLARHADPRHANAYGATALHWAIDDPAKVDALLAAGADPNAVAQSGETPVMLAAYRDDGGEVLGRLLRHGGNAHGAQGVRALVLAAGCTDGAAVEALLAAGADPDPRHAPGANALHVAASRGNLAGLTALLAAGADVNARDAQGRTPVMWAAQQGFSDAVTVLLAHGANPSLRETFSGTTALMQAAASDRADAAVVVALLAAGAALAPVDDEGASATVWATRRGDPGVAAALRAAGAVEARDPIERAAHERIAPAAGVAQALARAVPLLERAGPAYRAEAGCPSCHHDALPAMAIARAAVHGVAIDRDAQAREARAVVDALRAGRERFLQGVGFADVVEPAYLLAGLGAAGYPRDEMTDAMARYLALRQRRDGRWQAMMQRMPLDGSDVSFTALALQAVQRYAPATRAADTRAAVARARAYLRAVDAHTTEDLAFQALGLAWAGATAGEVAPVIERLSARRRDDGGFAQRDGMASDAYATGEALVALREAGAVPAGSPVIRRAVQFLLVHQHADGSWFVATRALPFQALFDTGFPHGRSQFIAAAATAWATMGLAAAGDELRSTR